ncbi:MAG: hypothetical protein OCD01_05650 [Fibrobacterales bacterium]
MEIEDREYEDFFQSLLDSGMIDGGKAIAITKKVIDDGGEHNLSEKQKFVFKKEVTDHFVLKECKCHDEIPWCEMLAALDNGGYCSWHQKMMENDK